MCIYIYIYIYTSIAINSHDSCRASRAKPRERRESLQNIADSYFDVEITIRNILQALDDEVNIRDICQAPRPGPSGHERHCETST